MDPDSDLALSAGTYTVKYALTLPHENLYEFNGSNELNMQVEIASCSTTTPMLKYSP